MATDNYERYVIGIRYTQKYRMALALQRRPPAYYQGYNAHKGEVTPDALLVLRAYYAILNEAKIQRFTPTCTTVWDREPTRTELLKQIGKGHLACLATHSENNDDPHFSNLLEAITQYREDYISFTNLCQAAGITPD